MTVDVGLERPVCTPTDGASCSAGKSAGFGKLIGDGLPNMAKASAAGDEMLSALEWLADGLAEGAGTGGESAAVLVAAATALSFGVARSLLAAACVSAVLVAASGDVSPSAAGDAAGLACGGATATVKFSGR